MSQIKIVSSQNEFLPGTAPEESLQEIVFWRSGVSCCERSLEVVAGAQKIETLQLRHKNTASMNFLKKVPLKKDDKKIRGNLGTHFPSEKIKKEKL